MIKEGKPVYTEDRRIEMTAYMGPRRAGKRYFNGEYGNPRDPEEGYESFWTHQVFQDYKDAGLTFLIPEGDAFFGQRVTAQGIEEEAKFENSDLYRFVQLAKKYDLKVYPSCTEIMEAIRREDGEMCEKEMEVFKRFLETIQTYFPETCTGILLTDEPNIRNVMRVEKALSCLREIAPELDVFLSFLPIGAGIECFQKDSVFTNFELKEKAYLHYIKTYANLIGEFSFDHYALHCLEPEQLSSTFYRNLELAAQCGLEHGFPISVTLQSFGMDTGYDPDTGKGKRVFRVPSYEDIRYQVYSALAFGVQRIGYFTFWQHYNEGSVETHPMAMIVYDEAEESGYRKTAIYDAVKKVNEQIQAFAHVFLRYRWKGCRIVNHSQHSNMMNVKGNYIGGSLKNINALRDTLIGCMENPEDMREGYWVVNAHNPSDYQWNPIELQFEEATHIQYYRAGKEKHIDLDKDGKFQIRLGAGEGIFVIPYKCV